MTAAREAAGKVRSLDSIAEVLELARAKGQRIVLCAGAFDILHVGQIRHLEGAKQMGDLLVVAVTPDALLGRASGGAGFRQDLRAEALAALGCVDFVAVDRAPLALEAIRLLRPHVYARAGGDGSSEEGAALAAEEAAVRGVGGKIARTDEGTFDASALLDVRFPTFSPTVAEYLRGFRARHSAADVVRLLDGARGLRVLVLGEAIIDEYEYCNAIGKSAKEPTLVVRMVSEERFAGGIVAVCNHVASFSDHVGLVTFLGHGGEHEEFLSERIPPTVERVFLRRTKVGTIVKRRFVDDYFFTKLFEVYDFVDSSLDPSEDERLCATLEEILPRYDVVVVFDFGHGMLSKRAIELTSSRARFLAVNTQSNAGNIGFNTISRYPRADFVCIAEHEIRLEARDRDGDLRDLVLDVAKRLSAPRVIVTRGSSGALCYDAREGFVEVPSFAAKVVDRVGAGDAFLSLTALCAAQNAPIELMGFIGNVAGAQAVGTVGHRSSVQRSALVKHVESLL